MPKGWVHIEEERCKGCSLCVDACPQGILALNTERFNSKGYFPVHLMNPDDCTGCAVCAIICPDVVFTVYRAAPSRTAALAKSTP
jgi:2-oxoglutarate ferredoxin oxidoreductase subunit delta